MDAAKRLDQNLRWLLITGPNLASDAFAAAASGAPANMAVERFRTNFAGLLVSARLSVSQAGYNTVCDVLRAGCRSVLVPFAASGETEQTMRAERLARLGLAVVLPEHGISGEALAAAIGAALAAPPPSRSALILDGAQRSAAILKAL